MSKPEPVYETDLDVEEDTVIWRLFVVQFDKRVQVRMGRTTDRRTAIRQATQAARRHRAEYMAETETVRINLT